VALPFVAEAMLFPLKQGVEIHPEPVSEHQPKICLILPLQNNTLHRETIDRVSSGGKIFPFPLFRVFSLGAGEIDKEKTNPVFSA